jgi:hypothetical protein
VFFEVPEGAFIALEGFFRLYSGLARDLKPCDQGALIGADLTRLR